MGLLSTLHRSFLGRSRLGSLIKHVAESIPPNSRILDIGCGSGQLAAGVMALRPDVHIEGLDLRSVTNASVPIHYYDGDSIPFPDGSWDVCMAIDVLHHCEAPHRTLREMNRVSSAKLLIKDHIADTAIDYQLLACMDWIGNRGYGTPLPYHFLSSKKWESLFSELKLNTDHRKTKLNLYPPYYLGLLDRNLHFLAVLSKSDPPPG